MIFSPIEYTLKDGRTLILRPPQEADAQEMLALRIKTAGETDFLMNYPEELASYSMEKQLGFISRMQTSENDFMAVAEVDGRIAGTCQLSCNTRLKTKHKAGIGIAILKEFWGIGIGSSMFTEMVKMAQQRQGLQVLELEVIEGNDRAMVLYRKFGFETVAEIPYAICLKDGTMLKAITMMKKL